MGLMGPSGFRGWSGGDKEGFTLSLSDATPSYLPGPIEPGNWTLLLAVPNIRSNVTSQFAAEVYFDRSAQDEERTRCSACTCGLDPAGIAVTCTCIRHTAMGPARAAWDRRSRAHCF